MMHRCYHDILSRIEQSPDWFDEYSVPRYGAFTPDQIANIYADECLLLRIECQQCGHPFDVAVSSYREEITLAQRVEAQTVSYGDPPNIECCAAGPTMSSVSKRVIQFWVKHRYPEYCWKRAPSLEIEVPD